MQWPPCQIIVHEQQKPEIDISYLPLAFQQLFTKTVQIKQKSQNVITITFTNIDVTELDINTKNDNELIFEFVESRLKHFTVRHCRFSRIKFRNPKNQTSSMVFSYINSGGIIDLSNRPNTPSHVYLNEITYENLTMMVVGNGSNIRIRQNPDDNQKDMAMLSIKGSFRYLNISNFYGDNIRFDSDFELTKFTLFNPYINNLYIPSNSINMLVHGNKSLNSRIRTIFADKPDHLTLNFLISR